MSESAPNNAGASASPADPAVGENVPVCPLCMATIEPLADFCRQCGAPLTALAAMDPYKQVFAQGWIYRKAASHPTSLIILVGMWLIFAGWAIVTSWGLLPWRQEPLSWLKSPYLSTLSVVLCVGILGLYGAILLRVTTQYLRYRSYRHAQCPQCGHNLTGLSAPRCPECGSPFDPKEVFDTEGPDEGAVTDEESQPQ